MRQIKSKKNKSTELRLIEIFKQNGITGWRRNYPVKGHPDFIFPKKKIAVFVDGCFWHGHDCRNTRPADHQEYWQKKRERNIKHDKEVTATSQFASNIQHDYVCTDPQTVFSRPNRIDPSVPIDATILPTNFSDLRYYWDCPKDYLLRRLMGFSPGVNESYGYGQQIHNLLALLHETLPNSNVDDAWIESQVDGHFNLRYTRGEPLEAMKAAAKRILKNYLHDDPELRSKVLHAEKPFEFIIGDAMISGTIDLLNKADPAGENEAKVEIVDFKTGKSGDDLAAAERRSHVQQQLQMYAIATQDALGLEPLKATAHFLYANQPHIKEDVELSEEQMENMKHQIANTVTAIKQGRFPLCASKTRCTSCDFKAICNGSTR